MDPTNAVQKGLLELKEALGRDSHVTKTFQARLAYIVANAVVGMIRLISLTLLFSGRTVPTLCLLEILMCASGNIFYDGPSPTMDILRAYLESGSSGLAMDPSIKVDLVAFELIPYCCKLLRSDKSFVAAGDDGVCLLLNPNHPTYSVESLRALATSYLYLFKWCKWTPFITGHGSLVSNVLGVVARAPPGLPMVMEVGELCADILVHHPHLAGARVNLQVHPSAIDRAVNSVFDLVFYI